MKTFGTKLREIRVMRDLSQDEMAALLGTTKQVISRYETEQRTPKLDTVQEYALKLGVPLLYLVDNSIESLDTVQTHRPAPAADLISDEESVAFRVVGAIAAGYDHEPLYDYTDDVQVYPRTALRGRPKEDYFVLRVTGRSMEPMIFDGDSVLIQRCDAVDQGTISVVLYNGDEATLNRVRYTPQWLEMIPVNPEYPVRRIEGHELEYCRILGKAVSLSRSLL